MTVKVEYGKTNSVSKLIRQEEAKAATGKKVDTAASVIEVHDERTITVANPKKGVYTVPYSSKDVQRAENIRRNRDKGLVKISSKAAT
ncbi:MAG TPA: hypothetical protein VEF34_00465 [Syntrophobacteraceae bacterium]|nr:hypothetical protein [Syntrophobacteraceae bacterium]